MIWPESHGLVWWNIVILHSRRKISPLVFSTTMATNTITNQNLLTSYSWLTFNLWGKDLIRYLNKMVVSSTLHFLSQTRPRYINLDGYSNIFTLKGTPQIINICTFKVPRATLTATETLKQFIKRSGYRFISLILFKTTLYGLIGRVKDKQ